MELQSTPLINTGVGIGREASTAPATNDNTSTKTHILQEENLFLRLLNYFFLALLLLQQLCYSYVLLCTGPGSIRSPWTLVATALCNLSEQLMGMNAIFALHHFPGS